MATETPKLDAKATDAAAGARRGGRVLRLIALGAAIALLGIWIVTRDGENPIGQLARRAFRSHGVYQTDEDPPASSPASRTPDRLRVLFIGNSFTAYYGGQARLTAALAEAAHEARRPLFEAVTEYGVGLDVHARLKRTLSRIREGNWDYVVIQDHSAGPVEDPGSMMRFGKDLDEEIRKIGAKTILFMTWARKDEPDNQAVITRAYCDLGRQTGAAVAPVGLAWRETRKQRPELSIYGDDDKHPNPAGSYLTACVFYATLYGHSPVGLGAELKLGDQSVTRIAHDEASFLQQVAWQTVQRFNDADKVK